MLSVRAEQLQKVNRCKAVLETQHERHNRTRPRWRRGASVGGPVAGRPGFGTGSGGYGAVMAALGPVSASFETLSVAGECDVLRAPELRERLLALLDTGRPVVVDLSDTSFLDSASLGVFVSAFKQARVRGQPLLFLVPGERSSNVRRVFEVTGLARVLPLACSWQEIEQSLTERRTRETAPASRQSP